LAYFLGQSLLTDQFFLELELQLTEVLPVVVSKGLRVERGLEGAVGVDVLKRPLIEQFLFLELIPFVVVEPFGHADIVGRPLFLR